MDRAEIINKLSKRIMHKVMKNTTWSDLINSVQLMTPAEKASFVTAIATGDSESSGKILVDKLSEYQAAQAKAYVEGMLVDDQLSLTELENFL